MSLDDFKEELAALLHPEPDEDGHLPQEYPHPRLREAHALDFSYFEDGFSSEGASTHRYTLLCPEGDEAIHALTRNQDVPESLFESSLRLFADSIIAYYEKPERAGELHFYPPVILTFWSGFETFVRHSSELLIATVPTVPDVVVNFLREREYFVDNRGRIKERSRFQPVLDRYSALLAHGYNWSVDRSNRFWKSLITAKELRDYYTHLDVREPRGISTEEVLEFMEAILLAIIWPSSALQRTLLLGIYRIYELWELMYRYSHDYRERPFFLEWHLRDRYLFHCNFEGVDRVRFPSMQDEHYFSRKDNEG
jgi:hypothetical protein